MSNAPKTGFFHTIPGLMTATAGFLSAATGAIVALNQTGVIDLKKMSGNQPAQQVAPLASPSVSAPSSPGGSTAPVTGVAEIKPAQPDPATEKSPIVPTNQPSPAAPAQPAASKSAAAPSSPSPAPSKPVEAPAPSAPVAEVKPQSPTTTPTSAGVTEAEKMKAIQEGAAAIGAPKKEEPSPATKSAPPVKRDEAEPSAPLRVADSATKTVKPPPSPARDDKPAASPGTKPVETAPIVKAPPPLPEKHKTPSEPTAPPGRVAETKTPQRGPVDDPARAKIVRPRSDAVASRTGGKRQVDGIEPGGVRPAPARETASAGSGRQLDLAGLKMTIPPGWVKEEVRSGPLAPVAALRIPDPAGEGVVQITRHLGAHGKEMEERTIERWLGQVTKANGAPSTMSDARIERRQVGGIRITTVDLAGTVKATPRDSGLPASRMVAAIVDHPAGPHLITIVGPSKSMAKWDAAIDGFLRSLTPD